MRFSHELQNRLHPFERRILSEAERDLNKGEKINNNNNNNKNGCIRKLEKHYIRAKVNVILMVTYIECAKSFGHRTLFLRNF